MKLRVLLTTGAVIAGIALPGCKRSDNAIDACPPLPDADWRFIFPDAFSPNGDGLNDILKPVRRRSDRPLSSMELRVFDPADQQVAVIFGASNGWDGTDQRSGRRAAPGRYLLTFGFIEQASADTPALASDGELYITLFDGTDKGCLIRGGCEPDRFTFADQIDPETGRRIYATAERFCR